MKLLALALGVIGAAGAFAGAVAAKKMLDLALSLTEDDIGLGTQSEQREFQKCHDQSFRQEKEIEGYDSDEELWDKLADDNELDESLMKIAIHEGTAFWISEEGLRHAPMNDDDEVEYHLQEPVDVHSMSQNQVSLMLEIIDALREDSE